VNALPRTGAGLFALVATAAFAAVGAALVSQHVFDMQPCPWCVLQRLVFVLIGLSAIAGVVVARMGERLVAWVVAGEAAVLAALGVAAALWQHFVAAATTSCNRTLADRIVNGLGLDGWLPDVFAPRASCADAAVKLLGVPYEFWSLALFVVLGVFALRAAAAVRGG
jgi:disulfide bond formation protein DsbB